jgi:hypothetical protein
MTLKQLLAQAAEFQWTFICHYSGEVDYKGKDPDLALEALEACDTMSLRIHDVVGNSVGACLIVTEADADPEEQIADYGGRRLDAMFDEA